MTWVETPLTGGSINVVTRQGDTVRRPTGPWTPAVHALLDHLEAAGFTGSPRVYGIDDQGREVLSFLPGECGTYPLRPHWTTDEALTTVAMMLRLFHDAQAGFRPPRGARWRSAGVPAADADVICHHDLAPHNVVWRPDGTLAMIDFDLASPGTRLYDVAYSAWTWVPLFSDRDSQLLGWRWPDRPRRLRLFADAYGLTPQDRTRLVQMVRIRISDHLEGLRAMIRRTGHPAAGKRSSQLRRPYRDLKLLEEEHHLLTRALRR
jgi:hypothetical protein